MAGRVPNTRNWKADEMRNPAGGYRLFVTGDVEVGNTNETPHLAEHRPQGINPKILLLDLSVTSQGIGNPVMTWKAVRFERPVSALQYSNVGVLWEGKEIASVKVETPK